MGLYESSTGEKSSMAKKENILEESLQMVHDARHDGGGDGHQNRQLAFIILTMIQQQYTVYTQVKHTKEYPGFFFLPKMAKFVHVAGPQQMWGRLFFGVRTINQFSVLQMYTETKKQKK